MGLEVEPGNVGEDEPDDRVAERAGVERPDQPFAVAAILDIAGTLVHVLTQHRAVAFPSRRALGSPWQRRGAAPGTKGDEVTTSFVLHRVADYDAWKTVYDSVAGLQARGGVTDQAVYQAARDPTNVLVMHEFGSADEAHAFFENPELREAMGKAGVDPSSLRVEFYERA